MKLSYVEKFAIEEIRKTCGNRPFTFKKNLLSLKSQDDSFCVFDVETEPLSQRESWDFGEMPNVSLLAKKASESQIKLKFTDACPVTPRELLILSAIRTEAQLSTEESLEDEIKATKQKIDQSREDILRLQQQFDILSSKLETQIMLDNLSRIMS